MKVIPQRELTDKDSVILNSGTIHISNNINLKQKQAWLYMVYRAFPNIGKQRLFRMYQSDLMKAINYTSDNKEYLREMLRGLAKCDVEFNILNKDGTGRWLITHLLASCEVIEKEGIIEYEFSEKLEARLINPLMYAKLNMLISKNFKSKHALNIYMLAMDYLVHKKNLGEKILTVQELKLYLGLIDNEGNELSKYRVVDIHKHILKKAEAEINDISDMNLTISPVKQPNTKLITGFRFQMSIKDNYVGNYSKLTLDENTKQLMLFDNIPELIKKSEPKKSIIAISDKKLKNFFSKYSISITTDTFQKKLKEAQQMFGEDNLENYLKFLSRYAEDEYKKGTIKNFAGFFVSLFKDNTQIDNYLYEIELENKKLEEKRIKIEIMLDSKIKEKYESTMFSDFENYLVTNIESLENKFIEIVSNNIKSGFAYDYFIVKQNNGIIDKTLILNHKKHVRLTLINELKKYEADFGYKKPTFEEWKEKTIDEKYLKNLRLELEADL